MVALAALCVTMERFYGGYGRHHRPGQRIKDALGSTAMNVEVVGLRFKPAGKILQYDADGLALHRGEKCVAESENGLEIATVVLAPHTVDLQCWAA